MRKQGVWMVAGDTGDERTSNKDGWSCGTGNERTGRKDGGMRYR